MAIVSTKWRVVPANVRQRTVRLLDYSKHAGKNSFPAAWKKFYNDLGIPLWHVVGGEVMFTFIFLENSTTCLVNVSSTAANIPNKPYSLLTHSDLRRPNFQHSNILEPITPAGESSGLWWPILSIDDIESTNAADKFDVVKAAFLQRMGFKFTAFALISDDPIPQFKRFTKKGIIDCPDLKSAIRKPTSMFD
jgi:hypothetical protein